MSHLEYTFLTIWVMETRPPLFTFCVLHCCALHQCGVGGLRWGPVLPDWAGNGPVGRFQGLRGRKNFGWAGGRLGRLLHKMNFLGPGIFLLFSTKNWGPASWAGFRIVRAGSLEKVW